MHIAGQLSHGMLRTSERKVSENEIEKKFLARKFYHAYSLGALRTKHFRSVGVTCVNVCLTTRPIPVKAAIGI